MVLTINELAPTVIEGVIRAVVDTYRAGGELGGRSGWKQALQLVAVCSKWRFLGTRIVYRHAYIESRARILDDGSRALRFYTNLDLACKTGNVQRVRHLAMRLDDFVLDSESVDYLVHRAIGFGSWDWSGVRSLEVRLYLGKGGNAEGSQRGHQGSLAKLFACILAKGMPNVSRLSLAAYSNDGLAKIVGNTLVRQYAQQLTHIESTYGIDFPPSHCFSRLEHLKALLSTSVECALPKVVPERLRHLELSNVTPATFSWSSFLGTYDGRAEITFENLRFLELDFSRIVHLSGGSRGYRRSNGNGNGNGSSGSGGAQRAGRARRQASAEALLSLPAAHRYRVLFPRLRHIKTYGSAQNTDFLPTDVYPDSLSSLNVCGSPASLSMWRDSPIRSIGSLNVLIFAAKRSEEDIFYSSTNYCFSSARCQDAKVNRAEMTLFAMDFALDAHRICWPNLTCLSTMFSIDYSTAVALVLQLPALVQLNSFMFNPANMPLGLATSIASPDAAESLKLAPLQTQLEFLCIYNNHAASEDRIESAALQLLLLQTRSLQSLVIHSPELYSAIVNFVDRFKPNYVHLAYIEVSVGSCIP
ncbi:hypothetical protein GGI07_004498 [Coemansia sp. Benny D115]|nr:hypothetical protein GGI07_004498 [Coemansia sp. Benny D115]